MTKKQVMRIEGLLYLIMAYIINVSERLGEATWFGSAASIMFMVLAVFYILASAFGRVGDEEVNS